MKISAWVWLVCGFALAIGIMSFAYFKQYKPAMEEAYGLRDNGDALQTQVNLTQKAIERRQKAIDDVTAMGVEWNDVVVRKTPLANVSEGGINVAINRWQLTVDAAKYRESVQRHVNYQTKIGGVKVLQGPVVPQPTDSATAILSDYFNYPAIKFPVSIWSLGQVTVEGTWPQIRENFRAWSTMPNYLVVADGLNVSGTSPHLTATYNVVLVAYVRGGQMSPLVPEGQSAAGGGGGGGGAGVPSNNFQSQAAPSNPGGRGPRQAPAPPQAGAQGGG